jgi:hypothetical protein
LNTFYVPNVKKNEGANSVSAPTYGTKFIPGGNISPLGEKKLKTGLGSSKQKCSPPGASISAKSLHLPGKEMKNH